MKKISNLGLPLTKQELKTIVGGDDDFAGCYVNCNPGYYSCCNNNGPTCKCETNGTTHSCDSGGPGSVSCSIT